MQLKPSQHKINKKRVKNKVEPTQQKSKDPKKTEIQKCITSEMNERICVLTGAGNGDGQIALDWI